MPLVHGPSSESPPDAADLARMREVFFRRTRTITIVLYAVFTAAGVGFIAWGLAADATTALLSWVAAAGVALGALVLGGRVPMSPRWSRWLVGLGALIGIVAVNVIDIDAGEAVVLGALGGFSLGFVAGTAYTRRRLGHDDALFLRQIQLGWDPEDPPRSMLGRTKR